MSIDTVLDRSGNVRDMKEIPQVIKPPWEVITFDKLEWIGILDAVDVAVLFPEISKLDKAKEIAEGYVRYLNESNPERDIETEVSAASLIRLYSGIPTFEFTPAQLAGIGFKLGDIKNNKTGRFNKANSLYFLRDLKLANPERDISVYLLNASKSDPDLMPYVLDKDAGEEFDKLMISDNLNYMAAMKIINPTFYDGIDLTGSEVYKAGVAFLNNTENENELESPAIAASLKVLAAKNIIIDSTGIHLEMSPALQFISAPIQVPEIERFEA